MTVLQAVDAAVIAATVRLARARGLDPWQARAAMVEKLSCMDQKSARLAAYDAKCRMWTGICKW